MSTVPAWIGKVKTNNTQAARPNKTKKGLIGTGNWGNQPNTLPTGQPPAWAQLPAWQPVPSAGSSAQTPPAYIPPKFVQVRTGEGTSSTIPYQQGMLTGTFFSGGTTPSAYNDMRGRGVNKNKGFMVTPPYVPQVIKVTGGNGGNGGAGGAGGSGGGYRGGGGGGGYTYNNTPSWLMNLNTWNWKG